MKVKKSWFAFGRNPSVADSHLNGKNEDHMVLKTKGSQNGSFSTTHLNDAERKRLFQKSLKYLAQKYVAEHQQEQVVRETVKMVAKKKSKNKMVVQSKDTFDDTAFTMNTRQKKKDKKQRQSIKQSKSQAQLQKNDSSPSLDGTLSTGQSTMSVTTEDTSLQGDRGSRLTRTQRDDELSTLVEYEYEDDPNDREQDWVAWLTVLTNACHSPSNACMPATTKSQISSRRRRQQQSLQDDSSLTKPSSTLQESRHSSILYDRVVFGEPQDPSLCSLDDDDEEDDEEDEEDYDDDDDDETDSQPARPVPKEIIPCPSPSLPEKMPSELLIHLEDDNSTISTRLSYYMHGGFHSEATTTTTTIKSPKGRFRK